MTAQQPAVVPGVRPRVALANLLLPGAGLICLGEIASGLLLGVAFAACANYALVATLILPDEFGRAWQLLGIGFAGGLYFGAQLRYSVRARARAAADAVRHRRAALQQLQVHMAAGDWPRALDVVTPLARRHPDDLFIAYRLAQILTAAGTVRAARAAWERLDRLDRRGLYRELVRERLHAAENHPRSRE